MPKIFTTLDKIHPVYEVIYKVFMFICKLLLVADILITSYAVAGRLLGGIEVGEKYLRDIVPFLSDPAWTEEVVLTLMSYMAVLSAALAIHRNAHIRMNVFDSYLPKKLIMILDVVSDLAVLILGAIMIIVGFKYAITIGGRGTYISLTWLSKFWMYFPIPLAGIAMVLFELESLYENVKKFFVKEDVQ